MFSSKQVYVVKCNQKDNRYLGFVNKTNKLNQDSRSIKVGQTESNRLDQALYFVTKDEAEIAKKLYIDSGVMNEKYIDKVKVEEVTAYSKDNYIETSTDLGFNAFMQIDTFRNYINS